MNARFGWHTRLIAALFGLAGAFLAAGAVHSRAAGNDASTPTLIATFGCVLVGLGCYLWRAQPWAWWTTVTLSVVGYVASILEAIDNGRVSAATFVSLVFLAVLVIPSITRDRPISSQQANRNPAWAHTAAFFMPLIVITLLLTAASTRTASAPTPFQTSISPTITLDLHDLWHSMPTESTTCFFIRNPNDRSELTAPSECQRSFSVGKGANSATISPHR
jgi:hypothetical protein